MSGINNPTSDPLRNTVAISKKEKRDVGSIVAVVALTLFSALVIAGGAFIMMTATTGNMPLFLKGAALAAIGVLSLVIPASIVRSLRQKGSQEDKIAPEPNIPSSAPVIEKKNGSEGSEDIIDYPKVIKDAKKCLKEWRYEPKEGDRTFGFTGDQCIKGRQKDFKKFFEAYAKCPKDQVRFRKNLAEALYKFEDFKGINTQFLADYIDGPNSLDLLHTAYEDLKEEYRAIRHRKEVVEDSKDRLEHWKNLNQDPESSAPQQEPTEEQKSGVQQDFALIFEGYAELARQEIKSDAARKSQLELAAILYDFTLMKEIGSKNGEHALTTTSDFLMDFSAKNVDAYSKLSQDFKQLNRNVLESSSSSSEGSQSDSGSE